MKRIQLIPGPLVYAGAGVAVLGLGYYFFSPKAQQKVHQGINKAEGKVRPFTLSALIMLMTG